MKLAKRNILFVLFLCCNYLKAEEGQSTLPASTWPQLNTLTGIKISKESTDIVQLIVLFDANCPHCAELWRYLYGNDSHYKSVVSLWVPVAYVNKDSIGKAASLINSNSSQALRNNFENFDYKQRSGAAVAIGVTSSMRLSLDRNMSTWEKIMAATPLLIYATKDGQVLTQVGLPPKNRLNQLLENLSPSTLQNYRQ